MSDEARAAVINKVSNRYKAGCAGGLIPATAGARAALAGFAILCFGVASAQPEDAGKFEVLDAGTELVDGIYRVSGEIYLRLPSDATRALQATLPLTIRVEVQFLNRLWFWWDNTEIQRIVRYRLSYYSLADRYVVEIEPSEADALGSWGSNPEGGDLKRETFPTLEAALEHIGRVDELPVVAVEDLDRNLRYDVRLRAVLDQGELPGPLRLLAFWRKDWSIGSEWLVWQLDAE